MILSTCTAIALHLSGLSYHWGVPDDIVNNEANYGLGVSCQVDKGERIALDVYKDSQSQISGHAVKEWDFVTMGSVTFGGAAGITYRGSEGAFPLALPYASVRYGRFSVKATVVPKIGNRADGAVAAQLRIHF